MKVDQKPGLNTFNAIKILKLGLFLIMIFRFNYFNMDFMLITKYHFVDWPWILCNNATVTMQ